MGRVGRAGVHGGRRDLGGGVGVPDGDRHAGVAPPRAITSAAPGSSGARVMTRRCPAAAACKRSKTATSGASMCRAVLGAAPGRGQERPLQVQAGHDALGGQAGQQGGPGFKLGQRRGHQAGHDARGAMATVKRRGAPGVVVRSLGE